MDLPRQADSKNDTSSDLYTITDLAQIGKQLGEATRIHVGNVYSNSSSGTRTRRPEITLTRDLEYLRLYDAKSGRILASYPDAATFFHQCAPHYLVIKRRDGPSKRILWHAVTGKASQIKQVTSAAVSASKALVLDKSLEERWLRCKIDHINQDGSSIPAEQQPGSVPTSGIVSYLESIVLDDRVFLLAAYTNGMLAAYTEDLQTANSPIADTLMGEEIFYMTTLHSERAKRGILRPVSNIHAMLDGTRLLAIISRPGSMENGNWLRVRIYQLSLQPSVPNRPIATLLHQFDVNLHQKLGPGLACTLHDGGQLHIWGANVLQIFDLSVTSTEAYRVFEFPNQITTVLRLNQGSVALCTTKSFQQLSLEYSTLQGSFPFPMELQPSVITQQYNCHLAAYDQKLGQLLCLYDTKIISIANIGTTSPTITELIDRGIAQSHTTLDYQISVYEDHLAKNPGGEVQWADWAKHVIALADSVKRKSSADFDKIFGKLLAFSASIPESPNWQTISLSPSQLLQNSGKLAVVVAFIFEPVYEHSNESSNFRLEVKFVPKKTFRWLLKHNYITSSQVEHCLGHIGKLSAKTHLEETAVVQALAEHKAALSFLPDFVLYNNMFSASQAVCVIAYALRMSVPKQAAITSSDNMEIDGPYPTDLPTDTLPTQESLDMDDKQLSLVKTSLVRLVDKDHSVITSALQKGLTHQQLFTLIAYLRFEMSQQGWFVEVLSQDGLTISNGNNQYTISRLVKILGCVLDALGMTPWLTSTMLAENDSLISWMRLEISAALEAVEEASYLAQTFHEVSLFTKLLDLSGHAQSAQEAQHIEPVTIDAGLLGNNALPVGLKPVGYVDTQEVKGGKTQKMSSRQIGQMKSKMVGAYSRERIDLNDF